MLYNIFFFLDASLSMKEIALRDKVGKKNRSGKQMALAEVKKNLQKKRQQLYFPGQKYRRKEKLLKI